MANFLVTGARAPVALEIIRNLHNNKHNAYLADSLRFPIAKNSRAVKKYFYIHQARFEYEQFVSDLIDIIVNNEIDYIIPTCEEIFYIAHAKERLEQHCHVICSDFTLLSKMHDKYTIMLMANDCCIKTPATKIIRYDEIKSFSNDYANYVLKKRFCRFGSDVIVNVDAKNVAQLNTPSDTEYLLQDKIIGEEICSYSIAVNGIVTAHCSYIPLYRLHESAGMYFMPSFNKEIYLFVKTYVKKHNFTGQLSFDFIKSIDGLFLIECNPRASSGVHLLNNNDLANAFTNELYQSESVSDNKPACIKLAMLLIMLPISIMKFSFMTWFKDIKRANDVITLKNDNKYFFFQLLSLAELILLSIKLRKSIRVVATHDIEWDGDKIS